MSTKRKNRHGRAGCKRPLSYQEKWRIQQHARRRQLKGEREFLERLAATKSAKDMRTMVAERLAIL